MSARRAAVRVVELARDRVDELVSSTEKGETLRELMVRAYIQGMLDGALCERLRAKSRGHYRRRGSAGAKRAVLEEPVPRRA